MKKHEPVPATSKIHLADCHAGQRRIRTVPSPNRVEFAGLVELCLDPTKQVSLGVRHALASAGTDLPFDRGIRGLRGLIGLRSLTRAFARAHR